MKFTAGDRVSKVGGSYQATGTIKAAFLADDGTPRYVFRFDIPAGMLHIFSETQLQVSLNIDGIQQIPKGDTHFSSQVARHE